MPEQALDWRRYLAAIMRYRWWIVAATVAGCGGGILASRMVPALYQTQTTIWIQTADERGNARGPIGSDQLFESSAWIDLLRSYVVLDEVARELRLFLRPDSRYGNAFASFTIDDGYRPGYYRLAVDETGRHFWLGAEDGTILQRGVLGDSIGRELGFRWAPRPGALPAKAEATFTVRPLRDAAQDLGEGLTLSIDPKGNFLRVSYEGLDAARTAATLNAVARRFVSVATELKRARVTELAKLLDEQRHAALLNLREAERPLEEFRARTITLSPDPGAQSGWLSHFSNLKLERDQLRRDREAIEQVLEQLGDSTRSVEGLAFIGAVQHSADLNRALSELTTKRAERRALLYRYTDDHPTVRRLSGEIGLLERRIIPSLATTLLTELAARERVLAVQVTTGGAELERIPQRVIDEARLRRAVEMATNLYASVQQRYDEARLAEASSVADVRVLDAAVAPQEPLHDKASRLVVFGLVAGLGLGLVGAVLVDRVDPRLRYPDQVTRQIGVPILGVLPHLKDREAGPQDRGVLHIIEAMRSVRLNLAHAYGTAGPLVFTVTSPGMGDGKSFVSANLALAYAEAGQPTLLIDGDSRRGRLHRVLKAARRPGLTDLLAARVSLDSVMQVTSCPTLHFVGAGTRFHDSPELLSSPEMVELLAQWRTRYRVIVVDSPPLGSGVDPYTLGTLTGSVVLVLRTGTTNLELTQNRLEVLERLPIRLLGVVLNDVRAEGLYRHYGYLAGYGTRDEGGEPIAARRQVRGVL